MKLFVGYKGCMIPNILDCDKHEFNDNLRLLRAFNKKGDVVGYFEEPNYFYVDTSDPIEKNLEDNLFPFKIIGGTQ